MCAFRGLGLRNGADRTAGAISDIYAQLSTDGDWVRATHEMIDVGSRVQAHFSEQKEIGAVIGGAIDLELALLMLTGLALQQRAVLHEPLTADGLRALTLPANLKDRVSAFIDAIAHVGGSVEECAIEGATLGRDMAGYYDARTEC